MQTLSPQIDDSNPPSAPAWGVDGCTTLKRVSVLKRFNSRKLPHLLEFENTQGQILKYGDTSLNHMGQPTCLAGDRGPEQKVVAHHGPHAKAPRDSFSLMR
jgi:hypothetical protein